MRPTTSGTITAATTYAIPNAATDRVTSYAIQFKSNSFVGSVTIKGGIADKAYGVLPVAYKNMVTGLNATAAITDNALVLVDAAGLDLTLDCTSYTSGSLTFTAIPLIG